MRRRRRALADVNLFSFQDVMASIIGLILFIVLLMAMSIVETPAQEAAEDQPPAVETDESTRRRAAEVHARLLAAQERVTRLRRAATGVPGDTRAALDDLKELERTLVELNRGIAATEAQRRQLDAKVAEAESAFDVMKARLLEQEAALTETTERAKSRRGGPRVAYILDEKGGGDAPEPWLVELGDTSIRAATADGSMMVLEFGGATADERRTRFLTWAKSRDPTKYYFVLLIKPSAAAWIKDVERALLGARFKVGSDLLPEDWRPFE